MLQSALGDQAGVEPCGTISPMATINRRIAEIAVASDRAGTTFTLDLPLSAPHHDPERPATIY